jgi:hypothetical protein
MCPRRRAPDLKIDGDFIKGLTSSVTDQLVVQSMVDIARGMGMKTIAEFVEAPETAVVLHEKGVDYSRGYYHGRPRPIAEEFANLRPLAAAGAVPAAAAPVPEWRHVCRSGQAPSPSTSRPPRPRRCPCRPSRRPRRPSVRGLTTARRGCRTLPR